MYSDLYCTKCDSFRPQCKNIAGGRASAAEALPLTQLEELIRLHPRPLSFYRIEMEGREKERGTVEQGREGGEPVFMNHFNPCMVCIIGL